MFNAYIDKSGLLHSGFNETHQTDGYIFIICTRGGCRISLYNSEYSVTANNLITLLPYRYFRVIDQQPNTEFYVVSFSQQTFASVDSFETIIENITHIIESPVVGFTAAATEIICDYIEVLMRIKEQFLMCENIEFVSSIFKQIVMIIGERYRVVESNIHTAERSRELVMNFMRLVALHYKRERGAIFYAGRMHVTLQHLSTVVRRTTNLTITNIIAMFVIVDAQTKLHSTTLSIGEIAAELHFDDISTFGRYFKRYTKLSPRQYRKRK